MNQEHTNCAGCSRSRVSPHVAVVEDEAIVRRALERLLRVSGFRVSTYASAEAFLGRDAAERPDCLILDLHFGGMTGLELQAALAARGERAPWVVITAHDSLLTRARCLEAGATAFLVKPFDDWQLLEAIERALGTPPVEG